MPSRPTPERPWNPVVNGPALREARTRQRLSQNELIERCAQLGIKVDRGNLHRAEHGQPGAIGLKKIPVVADALCVKLASLLTEHGRQLFGIQGAA